MFHSSWNSSWHYHPILPVYLIVKLFWINRMFIRLFYPFWAFHWPPSHLVQKSQTSLLLNTITRLLFCCTPWNLVFIFTPTLKRFLTPNYATKVLKLWFISFYWRKELTQPTLYSRKGNNPHTIVRIHQPLF